MEFSPRAAELTTLLESRMTNFYTNFQVDEIGQWSRLEMGLPIALNLENENVGIVVFGSDIAIRRRSCQAPLDLLPCVDALGVPIDGKGLGDHERRRVEVKARGLLSVNPGKTAIAIDTILNQKQMNSRGTNESETLYCFRGCFLFTFRLLEKTAKRSDRIGAGSSSCVTVIETQFGGVSAYIPTNVISITDGQISINVGLSVGRVGSAARLKAMKQVCGSSKAGIGTISRSGAFAQFGSDLDVATRALLNRGARLTNGLRDRMPLDRISQYEKAILSTINPELQNPS
ncbi:hypothetical protein ZWY2020_011262 [Hordeum vulgare]|nr:hypothetical protein ZWY2020_011262 [Hordeum vulgare]